MPRLNDCPMECRALFCVLIRLKQKRTEWTTKGSGEGSPAANGRPRAGPVWGDGSTVLTASQEHLLMKSVHLSP